MAKDKGRPAPRPKARTVSLSVRVDVPTNARVAAAAALQGIDKSTFCARAIEAALQGIVVFDRKDGKSKAAEHGDPSDEVDRSDAA